MITEEEYLKLREKPIDALKMFFEETKDWGIFKSLFPYSTFGDLFDNYDKFCKPLGNSRIQQFINAALYHYFNIKQDELYDVRSKVLTVRENIEFTQWVLFEDYDLIVSYLPKIFKHIINEMEQKRIGSKKLTGDLL